MHCEKFLVTKWISNNTYSAGCNRAGGERVVGSFSVFLKNRKNKELILHSVLVKQKEILTACWLLVRKMAQIWSYCCKILNVEIVARRPKRISFFFSALQAPFRIVVIFWVTFLPTWVSLYKESFSNDEGAEAKTALLQDFALFQTLSRIFRLALNLKCRWPYPCKFRERKRNL